MKFIKELKEDEMIVEHYLCKEKQSLKSKNGKTYFSLKLQDKSGTINAKVWDLNKDIQSFESNDYIKVEAVVLTYQNDLQLKVSKIRKSTVGEYEPSDFIPATDKNINVMYESLITYINSVSDKYVREMLTNLFTKHPVISSAIKSHSAAKNMHHSYMGGLLEHTVSVAELCTYMGNKYEHCNKDVLIAGALLHDVGKIYELSPFPENDYTDVGQLMGHLIVGVELVTEEAKKIEGISQELVNLIKHTIVAHHGELQYGSPKKPATIEAYILHLCDNIDAKVKMYQDCIDNDTTNGKWVGYSRILETNVRRSVQ